MTTHINHPDCHEGGLVDGCPRCKEHADTPLAELDEEMIAQLRERIRTKQPGRSKLEAQAMRRIAGDDWRVAQGLP